MSNSKKGVIEGYFLLRQPYVEGVDSVTIAGRNLGDNHAFTWNEVLGAYVLGPYTAEQINGHGRTPADLAVNLFGTSVRGLPYKPEFQFICVDEESKEGGPTDRKKEHVPLFPTRAPDPDPLAAVSAPPGLETPSDLATRADREDDERREAQIAQGVADAEAAAKAAAKNKRGAKH